MTGKGLKVTLCAALAFSLLALSACGGNESKDSDVKAPSAAGTEAAAEKAPESKEAETEVPETKVAETEAPETEAPETTAVSSGGVTGSGKFATVAEFAKSSEVQTQLEAQKKSLDGSGMDIAITGEDNKLIYTFTYLEMENQEGMAEALQQGLEAEKATFVSVAKTIKLAVDVDDPIVVVQYLDSKGDVIYSAEFTAE